MKAVCTRRGLVCKCMGAKHAGGSNFFNLLQKLINHKQLKVTFLTYHENWSITNMQWQNRLQD